MSKEKMFIVVKMGIWRDEPLPYTLRHKKIWAIREAARYLGDVWPALKKKHKLRCVPCAVEWEHQGHVLERKPKP